MISFELVNFVSFLHESVTTASRRAYDIQPVKMVVLFFQFHSKDLVLPDLYSTTSSQSSTDQSLLFIKLLGTSSRQRYRVTALSKSFRRMLLSYQYRVCANEPNALNDASVFASAAGERNQSRSRKPIGDAFKGK